MQQNVLFMLYITTQKINNTTTLLTGCRKDLGKDLCTLTLARKQHVAFQA